MEVVCASRRKKLKSRACMVTPSFYKADGDEDSDLRAYAVVRYAHLILAQFCVLLSNVGVVFLSEYIAYTSGGRYYL